MYKKILELHRKHRELINYLVTGGIGTVVSIGSFAVLLKFSNESVLSNVGSWIITIILMYVLNRYFVFLEHAKGKKEILKEMSAFVSARVVTLIFETLIVWLGIDVMKMNSDLQIVVVKTIGQILVVILNFVAAKMFVFKKAK